MKKRIKKLLKFEKWNFGDTLRVLLAMVIALVLIIVLISLQSNSTNQSNTALEEYINKPGSDSNLASPEDFPGVFTLLTQLSHATKNYSASYLPLEKDAKPTVVVIFLTVNGEEEFVEWLRNIDYVEAEVEFIYQAIPQVEDSPAG